MTDPQSALLAAIVGASGAVIAAVLNNIKFSFSAPRYKEDAEVDSLVSFIRHKYGCDRVTMLGYHNGGYWLDGKSISKFTCRHESTKLGVELMQPQMQNISTGFLKEMPSILSKSNMLLEIDINATRRKTGHNPAYYEVMHQFGTSATFALAVKKPIFKWFKLRYETEMTSSIHLNWSSHQWPESLLTGSRTRLELAKDLNLLIKMFDKKCKTYHNLYDEIYAVGSDIYEPIKNELNK